MPHVKKGLGDGAGRVNERVFLRSRGTDVFCLYPTSSSALPKGRGEGRK